MVFSPQYCCCSLQELLLRNVSVYCPTQQAAFAPDLHCASTRLRGHHYVHWVSFVFVFLLVERKGGCQRVDLLPEHSVRVMI